MPTLYTSSPSTKVCGPLCQRRQPKKIDDPWALKVQQEGSVVIIGVVVVDVLSFVGFKSYLFGVVIFWHSKSLIAIAFLSLQSKNDYSYFIKTRKRRYKLE